MPQLDHIIIFSQIFWLFSIFTLLYIILTHYFLPKFLKSFKARKQILNENLAESLSTKDKLLDKQLLIKQLLIKNLAQIEVLLQNKFTLLSFIKDNSKTQVIDEKIALTLLNVSLYCDSQALKAILLFPKSLNLKYKK